MITQESKNPHIIGLTGSFGSGCTYIAEKILEKEGYKKVSLSSDILKKLFQEETQKNPHTCPRSELQDYGDKLRDEKGCEFLANEAIKKIDGEFSEKPDTKWVIDSIRNPAEIHRLREYSRNFFLFGIYADEEIRWDRVKKIYNEDRRAFANDDKRDKGGDSQIHGQKVGDCFSEADVVISNNDHITTMGNTVYDKQKGKIISYVNLVQRPLTRRQPIRQEEALMAMAYAASQQSSCLKRKVGAIIVDELGTVISSGFNEVPQEEQSCAGEYKKCYRDHLCDNFFEELTKADLVFGGKEDDLKKLFRKQFKMLDYCRALHAEENAIINFARNGRSLPLDKCVLYTTTYPCRLCANKIANFGIKRLIYLEPYPDSESKKILKHADVNDEFFEGVTFKAYFRIYGEEK